MTRPLHPNTSARLGKPVVPLAVLVYLDVLGDPLYAWSGIGDLTFAAGETGDPSLDGNTFKGIGTVIEVSTISEGAGGSDAVEVVFPGVDPYEPMMRQIITYRNKWQFRRAVLWGLTLDPDTDLIDGKPFRLKTGRMDQAPYDDTGKGASFKIKIEGQQAYGNQPAGTRYSEQRDINPNDTSQNWVHSLANMTAELGKNSASSPASLSGNREIFFNDAIRQIF